MVNPGIYVAESPSKSWPWKSWRLTARPGVQLIKDKLVMNKLARSSANIGWRGKCVVKGWLDFWRAVHGWCGGGGGAAGCHVNTSAMPRSTDRPLEGDDRQNRWTWRPIRGSIWLLSVWWFPYQMIRFIITYSADIPRLHINCQKMC